MNDIIRVLQPARTSGGLVTLLAGCPIIRVLCDGWETTNPVRAKASGCWTASPLQIISSFRRTMIPEVFLQITVRYVLFAPHFSRKLSAETETPPNSLSWTILQELLCFNILQRNPSRNLKKTRNLFTNMGGGTGCRMCSPVCTLRDAGNHEPHARSAAAPPAGGLLDSQHLHNHTFPSLPVELGIEDRCQVPRSQLAVGHRKVVS